MKDRRFKIGIVSMHIVASWGKQFAIKVKDAIPEDSLVIKQEEDFETASMNLLIYNKEFEEVPEGEACPKVLLDIGFNNEPAKPKLIYPH